MSTGSTKAKLRPGAATILVSIGVGGAGAAVAGLIPGLDALLPFSPPSSILWAFPFFDVGVFFRTVLVLFALLAAPVGLILWHVGLLSGSEDYPRRSGVLIGIAAVASLFY